MKHVNRSFPLIILVALSLTVLGNAVPAYADHEVILDSIKSTIDSDPSIGAHDLQIIYRHKEVILKGDVASEQARHRVVTIAKNTDGVESVTDWMNVSPNMISAEARAHYATPVHRSDSEIASDVRSAIETDDRALAAKVSVTVRDGTATLNGNMTSFKEVDQVLSTTLMVAGVQDISSGLTVNGRPYQVEKFVR